MIINKPIIPVYGPIILVSVILGMIYIYKNLEKRIKNNKQILLYFLIYFSFSFVIGKMYNVVIYGEKSFFTAGLSAYGGLLGVVLGSIIFEKIIDLKKDVIKYTILSLPPVYALTKIACFLSGCCYGIPYNGILSVTYTNGLNIKLFPIQLVETVVFMMIFIVCNHFKNKKDISYITLMLVFVFKFGLDFLRYDHLNTLITKNQIVSIVLFIITIIMFIKDKLKKN